MRTEADRLLEIGDHTVDRAGQEFAPADMGISRGAAAVDGDRRLIFRNGLRTAVLGPQYLAPRIMRHRAVRRYRQGLRRELFGAPQVVAGRFAQLVERPDGEQGGQPGRAVGHFRIERQRLLEMADRLIVIFAGNRLGQLGPAAQHIIHRVWVLDRAVRLGDRELRLQRAGNARGDLILHREQVADVAVEAFRP